MTKKTTFKAVHFKPLASGLWVIEPVELPTKVGPKVEAIQKLVDGYFECRPDKVGRKGVLVYVNDEALVRGESRGFCLGSGLPFFGAAVIVSTKDNADLELSKKQLGNAVRIFGSRIPS